MVLTGKLVYATKVAASSRDDLFSIFQINLLMAEYAAPGLPESHFPASPRKALTNCASDSFFCEVCTNRSFQFVVRNSLDRS
ncbi:hypothetical protein T02_14649, partial [Trichinella nativa]